MGRESTYFTLSLESLRSIGRWAADCAERMQPVFEKHTDPDSCPRAAIEGASYELDAGIRGRTLPQDV